MSREIVLITGGTGFAGSHLAELLLKSPDQYEVHLTHVTPVAPELSALLQGAVFHELDLTNAELVTRLIESIKPTQIYQLASIPVVGKSFERAAEILEKNTAVVHILLEAVRTIVPTAKVLVVTSAEVYGVSLSPDELPISESHVFRPVNPYGVSKITQDALASCYARAFDLKIVTVRPFNHIGERQQPGFAVSDFASQIAALEKSGGGALRVGDLTAVRDFTDVIDMVAGYSILMENGVEGEAYNLGSGVAIGMQSIVDQLVALSTAPITIEKEDARLRPSDIPIMQADITKARALGWQPQIALSDSVARILEYWRTQ